MFRIPLLVLLVCFVLTTVAQKQQGKRQRSLPVAQLDSIFGRKGAVSQGEYKITIPQNDLKVVVDGFRIIPPMGLSTWTAFSPVKRGVMVMGDIVVTDTDLKEVQAEVLRQGLSITAIHNHFVRSLPQVMYMHIGGSGSMDSMAHKVKKVLDRVQSVRGHNPSAFTVPDVTNTIDTSRVDSILGYRGEWSKGVWKHVIGRPDVPLREHGANVSSFMGFNTWAAWQGTGERAAVAGDFAMLEDEVQPVIRALVENGIEVVAVHNHMLHERPRIFFLHYWGVGNALQLAKGLRQALDATGNKKRMGMH